MIIPTELLSVLAGAMTLLIASALVFGHRYVDKSSNLNEKSQIDELNEIRIAMRSNATVHALDKIWLFLLETDQKMRKERFNMDLNSLLYDINRREYFNKLINDLERTFRDSTHVKEMWENLRSLYGKLGNALYGFALTVALIGYPLLVLSSQFVTLLPPHQCSLLWILLVIVGISILGLCQYFRRKIASNMNGYKGYKEQYLVDELRILK